MELIDKTKLMKYKALAEQHLSDPIKLRLFTVGALLVLVIVLVYMPLSKKIDENERLLSVERERNGYIADCENLRKQAMAFCPLVMEKSDTNEWISYLLDGLRKFQVKLRGINSKQQRNVGPYLAAVLSMEIEGSYSELKNYIEWLESSESLVRIDTLQLEKVSNNLLMRIMVLGIVSKK